MTREDRFIEEFKRFLGALQQLSHATWGMTQGADEFRAWGDDLIGSMRNESRLQDLRHAVGDQARTLGEDAHLLDFVTREMSIFSDMVEAAKSRNAWQGDLLSDIAKTIAESLKAMGVNLPPAWKLLFDILKEFAGFLKAAWRAIRR